MKHLKQNRMELVKRQDHWALYNEDGHKIAATIPGCNSKLSLKNCQAIANGYDLDELAKDYAINQLANPNDYEHSIYASTIQNTYMVGFQKALEIIGDKKYNETDLYKTFLINSTGNNTTLRNFFEQKVLPTFNKTEFDVEIEWEKDTELFNVCPKLDDNGCLILKRL